MFVHEETPAARKRILTWREAYDFPMSWDWWRWYCFRYEGVDPGPTEPPHSVEEIGRRLAKLEEEHQKLIGDLSDEELRRLRLKDIERELLDLKQALRETYRLMGAQMRRKTKPKTRTKGVEL